MPITWDELQTTAADAWTIGNAPDRFAVDAWAGFDERPVDLSIAHPAVMTLLDTAGLELERFDRFRS